MNNIAYNVMTGLYFVTGKGFVAKSPMNATTFNDTETVAAEENWVGIGFVKQNDAPVIGAID